jgi:hypothetical protein
MIAFPLYSQVSTRGLYHMAFPERIKAVTTSSPEENSLFSTTIPFPSLATHSWGPVSALPVYHRLECLPEAYLNASHSNKTHQLFLHTCTCNCWHENAVHSIHTLPFVVMHINAS